MAEMRVSRILLGLLFLGIVGGAVFLVVTGITVFGIDLKGLFGKGVEVASGYGPAKSPQAAMDGFHKAIQARQYNYAALYTTKEYGEQLKRAHDAASPIGDYLDSIRRFGKEKGHMTDRLTYALYKLDPFPRNFKLGPAPVVNGDKATGTIMWESEKYDTQDLLALGRDPVFKELDKDMFTRVLLQPLIPMTDAAFTYTTFNLVKEGEDWKLAIPSNQFFELSVGYFNDHHKAYKTQLNSFVTDMNRLRNAKKSEFEMDVLNVLREAK